LSHQLGNDNQTVRQRGLHCQGNAVGDDVTGHNGHIFEKAAKDNGLVAAFAVVGLVVMVSGFLPRKLTFGRVQGSAIAILIGLAMAYVEGKLSGGTKGLADIALFSGVGLMGGNMLRDFAIVATAFEVHPEEARRACWIGLIALLLGTVLPFIVGVGVASAFGYTDAVSLTTIGAGAVAYIVGPVTGTAIGASSDVIAPSIATGVIKAIIVMVTTPAAARFMRLKGARRERHTLRCNRPWLCRTDASNGTPIPRHGIARAQADEVSECLVLPTNLLCDSLLAGGPPRIATCRYPVLVYGFGHFVRFGRELLAGLLP
jgi:malonate transporter MadM subunit